MNAVNLLHSPHRRVEDVLARLETTVMKRHREMLVAALADDLTPRPVTPEHQFDPAVRAEQGRAETTRKALDDHMAGIKRLLTNVACREPGAIAVPMSR